MLIEWIQKRRSIRNYKPDPIPDEMIKEIITAGQMAPTANNNQGIEYIIVRDPHLKSIIYQITEPRQEFVQSVPVLLIPIIDREKSNLPKADLSLASQNIFLQATALGLGSIWKNCYAPVAKKILALLNVPDNYVLINIIPIGYAAEEKSPYTADLYNKENIHSEKFNTS
jgi:nitroreductase